MDIKTSTEPTSLRREREDDEGGASFRIGYRSIGGIISTKRPVYSRCRCVMFEGVGNVELNLISEGSGRQSKLKVSFGVASGLGRATEGQGRSRQCWTCTGWCLGFPFARGVIGALETADVSRQGA